MANTSLTGNCVLHKANGNFVFAGASLILGKKTPSPEYFGFDGMIQQLCDD
jgi:hypothetical protein